VAKFPEPLIGGDLGSEEEQRLRLLELVQKYFRDTFGVSLEDDATADVGKETVTPEEFSFPAAPELPELPRVVFPVPKKIEGDRKKNTVAPAPHVRTQEEINRDLERLGFSIQILQTEEDRVRAEVDAWLDANQMTPRTALICVEEIVRALRDKQVAVEDREVRKHLLNKMPHR